MLLKQHRVDGGVTAAFVSCVSPDDSDPASLSLWPNSAQLFEYDKLALNCSHNGNSLGWKVVRASHNATSNERLRLQHCGDHWGRPTSSGCELFTIKRHDTGVYWCESPSKVRSNLVNISVYGESNSKSGVCCILVCTAKLAGFSLAVVYEWLPRADSSVILWIPALPVKEGTNVTLHCKKRNDPSNQEATFYKNGDPLKTEPTGHMTIVHVSRSDEGVYWCKINDHGKSPPSWLFVTGQRLSVCAQHTWKEIVIRSVWLCKSCIHVLTPADGGV